MSSREPEAPVTWPLIVVVWTTMVSRSGEMPLTTCPATTVIGVAPANVEEPFHQRVTRPSPLNRRRMPPAGTPQIA